MAEQIIVGAGFAGLVAGINLARDGMDVRILEKESRIGGDPLFHPSPEGTPLPMEKFAAYTGIDLSGSGKAMKRYREGRLVLWDKVLPAHLEQLDAWNIERGPRSTSLDTFLYNLAVEAGVKFEFNHPIWSNNELAQLPPNTIVATGLNFGGFDATGQPYKTSFHYVARKANNDESLSRVCLYFGDYTRDYGYTTSTNGLDFAHCFQRDPIGYDTLKRFEEQIYLHEGLEFDHWDHFTFPVPAASINTPRLFAGDKILAGTLAGAMEAILYFGQLGGLVTGKIAALAVKDKAVAYKEFKKALMPFRTMYLAKKASLYAYPPLTRFMMAKALPFAMSVPGVPFGFKNIMPGWRPLMSGPPKDAN